MDNKERFDQIERLLTDLLRRADRQDEFNTEVRQRLTGIDNRLDGIDNRLDSIDNRLDSIVDILKISAEAHRQSEERWEQVQRDIREQGRRTDLTQAEILRMLDAMEAERTKASTQAQQLENHEPRIQRLEDDVFRAAS